MGLGMGFRDQELWFMVYGLWLGFRVSGFGLRGQVSSVKV